MKRWLQIATGVAAITVNLGVLSAPAKASPGPVWVAGPYQRTSFQGVSLTMTAGAVGQGIGVDGEAVVSLSCAVNKNSGWILALFVSCWLTADGGVTVPTSNLGISPAPNTAPAVAAPSVDTVPSEDYQLCVMAAYLDSAGRLQEVPGGCSP